MQLLECKKSIPQSLKNNAEFKIKLSKNPFQ